MSTDRGGSDLDVFNDLKPQTPDGKPITEQARTLVGLQVPEGGLPPVPGSMSSGSGSSGSGSSGSGSGGSGPSSTRSMPPPPPSQRPKRSGAAPPLPPPS